MSVKITGLGIENVQRVHAFDYTFDENGLTIIGGDNRQGKTTTLRSIAATLGGGKFSLTDAVNDEAVAAAQSRGEDEIAEGWSEATLSNGIVVRRTFLSDGRVRLRVTGPDGRGNQSLLNEFICEFALNLPAFLNATAKKKAALLLESLDIDLTPFEERISAIFKEREDIGRDKTKAEGHLKSLPYHQEMGTELKSAVELTDRLEEIRQRKRANADHRELLQKLRSQAKDLVNDIANQTEHIEELEGALQEAKDRLADMNTSKEELVTSGKALADGVAELEDLDPAPVQLEITQLDQHNGMIQHNLDYEKAQDELAEYTDQYAGKTADLAQARQAKLDLLAGCNDWMEGLTVEDEELLYQGKAWDSMSHADQIIVGIDIVSKINPEMGFVLVDTLEALDLASLERLNSYLQERALQGIGTRVSTGPECTLIIDEGRIDDLPTA